MSKFIRTLVALFALVLLVLGFAPPAGAYDYTYQIPNDGLTHTIVGSEPYLSNDTDVGCHYTGVYSGQRVVFCVWFGANDTIGGNSYSGQLVFALKWRCYDASNTAVQCGKVDISVAINGNGTISNYRARCQASTGGAYNTCMGLPGSGTYTNNTGWLYYSNYSWQVSTSGYYILWNPAQVYTVNEYLNDVAVASASTPVYRITENYN